MLGRSTGRHLIVVAVLVATCTGAMALAAAKHPAKPHPRPLKYACASNLYNAKNVLQYVARRSACRRKGKRLVAFAERYPIYTCRKEHGHRRRRMPSAVAHSAAVRHHGPAGLMRLVKNLGQCAPPTQPNETPIMLPLAKRQYFCAAKRGGELRWVRSGKHCDRKEFPVLLAKRNLKRFPRAVRDIGATNENRAAKLPVLVNDYGKRIRFD